MNPYVGVAVVVAVLVSAHLYGCARCRRMVRDWMAEAKDFVRRSR